MTMTALFDLFGDWAKAARPSVRPLKMIHAGACARIHAAGFAHAWNAGDFEALIADAATCADGATVGATGRLLGFVVSRVAADEAEILTIAVDAAMRRRGAGRAMLEVHLARLAERGAKSLFLEVDAQNKGAMALYAHFGFRQVGERRAYYTRADGGKAQALILRRDLE